VRSFVQAFEYYAIDSSVCQWLRIKYRGINIVMRIKYRGINIVMRIKYRGIICERCKKNRYE